MIHTLTLVLLRKALADGARMPPSVGLSFNLSAQDLASPETVIAILAAVRESGLDPSRLTLELTETALMRDFAQAKDAITTLRALGIKIALDDFGTGYSSLGYVHRLPLDKIKIDRSFISGLDTEVSAAALSRRSSTCARTSVSTASPRASRRRSSSPRCPPRLPLHPGLLRRPADAHRRPAAPAAGPCRDASPDRLRPAGRIQPGAAAPPLHRTAPRRRRRPAPDGSGGACARSPAASRTGAPGIRPPQPCREGRCSRRCRPSRRGSAPGPGMSRRRPRPHHLAVQMLMASSLLALGDHAPGPEA